MRPLKQAVYSSRTADKFVLRLPDGMRESVAVLAKDRHQSMNSYMVSKLERAVAIDIGEHTPYTPVMGMVLEHKASHSVGTLDAVVAYKGELYATLTWLTMEEGCPAFREPVGLADLRPYVV